MILEMLTTRTWSWRRNLVMLHGQPVVAGGPLLLELSREHGGDVPETEGAHRGPADRVRSRAENSVDHCVNFIAVITLMI